MKLSVALLGIALCLSYASASNNIAEQAAVKARETNKGLRSKPSISLDTTSLLVAEPHQISQITLYPPSRRVIKRTPYIGGVDYHAKRHRVYWSEISTGRINARNLTGPYSFTSECIIELSPKEWRPRGIAVDFVTDNIYVLDSRGMKVHVVDLQRKLRTVIYEGELKAPTDITIDPEEAVLFVADSTRILKLNMDGSESTTIVSDKRYNIRALTLDTANKKIFWSDMGYHRIKSANYDGSDVQILVKNKIGQTYSVLGPAQLSYYDGNLYFYDDVYRKISTVEVDHGVRKSDKATMIYDRVNVKSIKVLNSGRQTRKGINPCDDAECEEMCLIAKKIESRVESKCACEVGKTLADDEKSCS